MSKAMILAAATLAALGADPRQRETPAPADRRERKRGGSTKGCHPNPQVYSGRSARRMSRMLDRSEGK